MQKLKGNQYIAKHKGILVVLVKGMTGVHSPAQHYYCWVCKLLSGEYVAQFSMYYNNKYPIGAASHSLVYRRDELIFT